jgi:hypothetical protein
MALFYLNKFEIINEFRYKTLKDYPDILRFVIDPDEIGSSSLMIKKIGSFEMNSFINKKKEEYEMNHNKIKKLYKKTMGVISTKNTKINDSRILFEDVISDDDLLKYFKVHCAKEYNLENILFIEDVNIFKKESDKNSKLLLFKKIFENYIFTNSINEINISQKQRTDITNKYEQNICTNNIFDNIIFELINSSLMDSFSRFTQTTIFNDMKKKKSKNEILDTMNYITNIDKERKKRRLTKINF